MFRQLVFAITIISCFTMAEAQQTSTPKRGPETANAPQGLEEQNQAYRDALTKKDVAALDKIWAADYTFINPHGDLVTKAERLANVKSGATEFQDIQLQRERLHVHGNVAVDIGKVILQGTKYSGRESSGDYRYMNVWVKLQGRWQLLANQVTLMQK
jgi:ketosteroid isomerase-like protein